MKILNEDVQRIPIEKPTLHPQNPRNGDLTRIIESIETNGFWGAIVVQKSTGHVLVGNHRLMAARELDFSEVPAFYVDVNDEEALRILTADNKTSDEGSYYEDELYQLLEHINSTDQGLTGTGYTEEELSDLGNMLEPPSLDDLEEAYGEVDEEELWPKISVKVPPDVEDLYEQLMGEQQGDNDAERFENLLHAVQR